MKELEKKGILFFVILCGAIMLTKAQNVPQINKNYSIQRVYDDNGNVISYIQTYQDKLGRTEQIQQKDLENGNVIVQQPVFDRFGRPALQTLPAPVYKTTTDEYLPDFITNSSGNAYDTDDFDKNPTSSANSGELFNPVAVGGTVKGSLGWYYSNVNNEEAYVASSQYPYVRTHYSKNMMNFSSIQAAAGYDLRMGSGREKRLLFKHLSNELKDILADGELYYKSVSIDEEKLEEVTYTDAEGKVVAQCYSGVDINQCVPILKTYYLNYGNRRSVDLHIPEAATLEIEKVLPTSNCTTITPAVNIRLINLIDGTVLVENVHYSIDAYNVVSFLGHFANRPNFIQVRVEYPSDWLQCANNDGSINLKEQRVTLKSFYGDYTLYKYDDKGNLIQVIPPAGVDCVEFDPTLEPFFGRQSKMQHLYGTTDSEGKCVPNHIMNSNLFSSMVFEVPDEDFNYAYEFVLSTTSEIVDLEFENDPPPACDYVDENPQVNFNFDEVDQNVINFETGELVINGEGEGEGEGGEEETPYEAEDYSRELQARALASELFYTRPILPEITVEETLGSEGHNEVIEDFLSTNIIQQNILNFPSSIHHAYGETDTSTITQVLIRKRGGTSLYDNIDLVTGVNLGGETDFDPYDIDEGLDYPCYSPFIHCNNDKQDCGEVAEDLGGPCYTPPPCKNKPLVRRGSIRIKIKALAKDRTTNIWSPINILYRYGRENVLKSEEYIYYDLLYTCECKYYLVRRDRSGSGVLRGNLNAADMVDIEQLKFELLEVMWSPNSAIASVFQPLNTHNVYEYFAHFIRVDLSESRHKDPKAPAPNVDLTKATDYEYNFFNQLTRVSTPDEGATDYYYDANNRLKFSRTAAQAAADLYSYIDYDENSRVVEKGVLSSASFPSNVLNTAVSGSSYTLSEQTTVEYDAKGSGFPGSLSGYTHNYLKGKVSKTANEESETWYGYDQRGRISWTVQRIPDLDPSKYFTLNYHYNEQGNIETLDFQQETSAERFVHHYTYDANGKLSTVKTSTDGDTTTAQLNAAYQYYQHGPLKRVELGDELQGIDYVYTINNRLKSINNPVNSRDPGKDGESGGSHAGFAQDIFGMTLDYFLGDYSRNGTGIQTYSEHYYDLLLQEWVILPSRYDGTLQGIRWRTRSEVNTANPVHEGKQLIYMPKYDVRKRLTSAHFGTINASSEGTQNTGVTSPFGSYNGPSPTVLQDFKVWDVDYDLNGNLKTLKRNGNYLGGVSMDELSFERSGNRLQYITDAGNATNYGGDIKTQVQPSEAPNYHYDASGRMTQDVTESNYLEYNSSDLPTFIYGNAGKTQLKSSLLYDERGQRIRKTMHDGSGTTTAEQFYIRDVNGIVMAVVHNTLGANPTTVMEHPVYGAAQLGTYQRGGSSYKYQLSDHLGNVRATIDGTKQSNEVVLLSMQDYYPFGSKMPNRSITVSDFYRLGYQGQPEDEATGFNAFELRLYDARIGGWLSPDPYKQHHSPYMAMSNNPFSFIDPDGGYDGIYTGGDDNGNNWGAQNEGWNSAKNTLAIWDMLQNACPDCSGSQLNEIRLSLGTGRMDQTLDWVNWQLSYENGTIIRSEKDNYYWEDVEGPYGNRIGTRAFIVTEYSSKATNYIKAGFIPDFIDEINVGSSFVGTIVGGLQYGVEKAKNKDLHKIAQDLHKGLKNSFNVNVKQSTIRSGLKTGLANASRNITYLGLGVSAADVLIDGQVNASHLLNFGVVGLSAIPVVGWGIGGAYFVSDLITIGVTGKSIGGHLDSYVGGPIVEDIYEPFR